MSVSLQCTKCGSRFHAPDGSIGKHARCPKCHEELIVLPLPDSPSPKDERRNDVSQRGQETGRATSISEAAPTGEPPSSCPRCHVTLSPGAVLCVDCGYDRRAGKQITIKKEISDKPIAAQPNNPKPVTVLQVVRQHLHLPVGAVTLVALILLIWFASGCGRHGQAAGWHWLCQCWSRWRQCTRAEPVAHVRNG
jgi:hypothetical protein